MAIKLWHCSATRSIRPLWALLEMDIDHEVVSMPFPPRFTQEGYLDVNNLGTVPYFTDGDTHMTESSGICLYLVNTYDKWDFGLNANDPEYGEYLNWLFHSDATLTFPQAVFLRYAMFEKKKGLEQAGLDYAEWFRKRLVRLEARLEGRDYLVGGKFTIADITVGYAVHLAESLSILGDDAPRTKEYLGRLNSRPALKKALSIGPKQKFF